jgi:16S rRNA C967 or C1407 C5-methylase (RsmB/RsmF family)
MLGEPRHAALSQGLLKPYFLDPASQAVALILGVKPGDRVLDMCAAPGGKSLVLARGLAGSGELVANERSSARRSRLHHVLERHLSDSDRSVIRVTSHDASRWALYEPEQYDRVLADVPCSSERHVIQSAGALASWSSSRSKRLAQAAYAIACAGADSLRTGGFLVYSTCALSPLENDGVVKRIVDRGSGSISVDRSVSGDALMSLSAPGLVWERTEYGYTVLPDRNIGAGPMYFARLRK